jgi:hypothetical protein
MYKTILAFPLIVLTTGCSTLAGHNLQRKWNSARKEERTFNGLRSSTRVALTLQPSLRQCEFLK